MTLTEIKREIGIVLYYRIPAALKRCHTALAYACGRTTVPQALSMIWDCQQIAGTHTLVSIDTDDVLRAARERWVNQAKFPELARWAAAHVGSKWTDDGETRSVAVDWALQTMAEDARAEGIALRERDEIEEPEPVEDGNWAIIDTVEHTTIARFYSRADAEDFLSLSATIDPDKLERGDYSIDGPEEA